MAMDSGTKKYIVAAITAIIVALTGLVTYINNQPDVPPIVGDTTHHDSTIVVDTTIVTPPPVGTIGEGIAVVAALPQLIVDPKYPVTSRQVRVSATANLQAVLDSIKGGDEVLLPVGSSYTGNYIIKNKPSNAWIVIRTDIPDALLGAPGTQMTPSRAASLKLAKIISNSYSPAIGTENGTHHVRFVGVEVAMAPAVAQMNMLVRFGESAGNGQKTVAQTPHDLGIDRSYVHGNTTGAIRRCALLNSRLTLVVDSWLDECHDPGGDSQATLGYNGSAGVLLLRNTLIAGHEIVMWGGSDPADSTMSPRDVQLWFNHIYRPSSWIGKWQMKTLLETKNVVRYDIYGNVIENVKADAQAGFAMLFKSENQDKTAPYSQTSDVTIRYNIIRNIGNGFNFSGYGSAPQSTNPSKIASRFTVVQNWVYNINKSPWVSDGIAIQLLSNMTDAIFNHNTIDNCGVSNSAITLDGAPAAVNLVLTSNLMCNGQYGIKGGGTGSGTPSLTQYAKPFVVKGNAFVGGGSIVNNFTVTSLAAAAGVKGSDGVQVGADTTAIKKLTANVIVAP